MNTDPNHLDRRLLERLHSLLKRHPGALPSLENAARMLGMSGRTLRRSLARSGTTYQNQLDQIRLQQARDYFVRGGSSITELSLALGYNDSSSFARAFRRWSGLSPSQYQARQAPGSVTHRSESSHWPD